MARSPFVPSATCVNQNKIKIVIIWILIKVQFYGSIMSSDDCFVILQFKYFDLNYLKILWARKKHGALVTLSLVRLWWPALNLYTKIEKTADELLGEVLVNLKSGFRIWCVLLDDNCENLMISWQTILWRFQKI